MALLGAEPKGLDLRMARRNTTRGTHRSPKLALLPQLREPQPSSDVVDLVVHS